MGYTHYYQVIQWDSPEWQAAWPLLVRDTQHIIESAGIPITSYDGPIISSNGDSICFNGVDSDSHEDFCLSEENNRSFAFTKTLRKPYDVVVSCVLLRAHVLAPSCMNIRSDGYWSEYTWRDARELYEKLWPGEPATCPWGETVNGGDAGDNRIDDSELIV